MLLLPPLPPTPLPLPLPLLPPEDEGEDEDEDEAVTAFTPVFTPSPTFPKLPPLPGALLPPGALFTPEGGMLSLGVVSCGKGEPDGSPISASFDPISEPITGNT